MSVALRLHAAFGATVCIAVPAAGSALFAAADEMIIIGPAGDLLHAGPAAAASSLISALDDQGVPLPAGLARAAATGWLGAHRPPSPQPSAPAAHGGLLTAAAARKLPASPLAALAPACAGASGDVAGVEANVNGAARGSGCCTACACASSACGSATSTTAHGLSACPARASSTPLSTHGPSSSSSPSAPPHPPPAGAQPPAALSTPPPYECAEARERGAMAGKAARGCAEPSPSHSRRAVPLRLRRSAGRATAGAWAQLRAQCARTRALRVRGWRGTCGRLWLSFSTGLALGGLFLNAGAQLRAVRGVDASSMAGRYFLLQLNASLSQLATLLALALAASSMQARAHRAPKAPRGRRARTPLCAHRRCTACVRARARARAQASIEAYGADEIAAFARERAGGASPLAFLIARTAAALGASIALGYALLLPLHALLEPLAPFEELLLPLCALALAADGCGLLLALVARRSAQPAGALLAAGAALLAGTFPPLSQLPPAIGLLSRGSPCRWTVDWLLLLIYSPIGARGGVLGDAASQLMATFRYGTLCDMTGPLATCAGVRHAALGLGAIALVTRVLAYCVLRSS